jgi:hypothetical protein
MGLAAVERLQSEVRRIYADIDAQAWSPSQKIVHYRQILSVFAAWFLAAMPPNDRAEALVKIAAAAERAPIGSAPRIFH